VRLACVKKMGLVAAMVLAVVACQGSTDDDEGTPPGSSSSQRVSDCRTSLREPASGLKGVPLPEPVWDVLPAGDIGGRRGPSVAWTGREMIVWGGEIGDINAPRLTADGAAYDPATRTWRELSASPLTPRAHTVTAWTGSEVLIWGGSTFEGARGAQPVGGATPPGAYDPASDTWRELPPGPLDGVADVAGAWTGSELMILGRSPPRPPGRSPRSLGPGGEMVGAAFSPCTNRWRRIASAPIEPRGAVTPVWTGSELLVWGGNGRGNFPMSDGAAYDSEQDSWRLLPPVSVRGYYAPKPVWTGTEMLVWGWSNLALDRAAENETVAYNPRADEWRSLPAAPLVPPPDQFEGTLGELTAWTGESLLAWSATLDAEGPLVLKFDPLSEQWTRLSPAPASFPYSPDAVWTGHELVVLGVGPDLAPLALRFAERQ
jgi:hypothetical protein